jgi:RNA polymerase sigma factor (TIGR02999 family)
LARNSDVTGMLLRWSEGDQQALDHLVPVVYDELKRLARQRLRREDTGHTLSTTGLVHEAYLKLVDVERVKWKDRNHFLAIASRVMRRVLIDYAKQRRAQKRGGGARRVEVPEEDLPVSDSQAETLLDLHDALDRMAQQHPRQSKALELYYFGGLTQSEIAPVLGVSQPTVAEDLRFARAWLARAWQA